MVVLVQLVGLCVVWFLFSEKVCVCRVVCIGFGCRLLICIGLWFSLLCREVIRFCSLCWVMLQLFQQVCLICVGLFMVSIIVVLLCWCSSGRYVWISQVGVVRLMWMVCVNVVGLVSLNGVSLVKLVVQYSSLFRCFNLFCRCLVSVVQLFGVVFFRFIGYSSGLGLIVCMVVQMWFRWCGLCFSSIIVVLEWVQVMVMVLLKLLFVFVMRII